MNDGGRRRVAPQWECVELELAAQRPYAAPYRDVEAYVVFSGAAGETVRRPAFWDGGQMWRVRFASPLVHGTWRWRSYCSHTDDAGLHACTGELEAVPYTGNHPLTRHGLLRMSPGRRTVMHHDGRGVRRGQSVAVEVVSGQTGWDPWAHAAGRSWREALAQPGSRYPGVIGLLLAGYDCADMTILPETGEHAVGTPGVFYCVYLPHGGRVTLRGMHAALPYGWFNPRTGALCGAGTVQPAHPELVAPCTDAVVLLAGYRAQSSTNF